MFVALWALEALMPGLLLVLLCLFLLGNHLLLHVLLASLQLHAEGCPGGGGVGKITNDLLLLDIVEVSILQKGLQLLQHIWFGQMSPSVSVLPWLWLCMAVGLASGRTTRLA